MTDVPRIVTYNMFYKQLRQLYVMAFYIVAQSLWPDIITVCKAERTHFIFFCPALETAPAVTKVRYKMGASVEVSCYQLSELLIYLIFYK